MVEEVFDGVDAALGEVLGECGRLRGERTSWELKGPLLTMVLGSCRTGPLRGERALRAMYTASLGATPMVANEISCRPSGGPREAQDGTKC